MKDKIDSLLLKQILISAQAWRAANYFHSNIRGVGNDKEILAAIIQLAINEEVQ